MEQEALREQLINLEPSLEFEEEGTRFVSVLIKSDLLFDFATKIQSDNQLAFNFLFCQTAIDYLGDDENPGYMLVVYHLRSTENGHEIVVKAKIENRESPEIDSVVPLWKTAEFHEREIYDLFGVKFRNHPDLRRIFLEDDWEGYPLRKDYVDEINIVDL